MAPLPKPATSLALPASKSLPRTWFPISSCGPQIEAAITAAAVSTQAPPELIAHHLLTLAATAAQRLISVRLPTGRTQPVSAYFLSIAGSGEGRSTADAMCVGPVRAWERRAKAEVLLPLHRVRSSDRVDRYSRFTRSGRAIGLFAGNTADLLTPCQARRSEADSLSGLWDGAAAVTSFHGVSTSPRLSAHLVATMGEGLALLRA